MSLEDKIVELYKKAAVELSEDVVLALDKAKKKENNSLAKEILAKILENTEKAKAESKPICQDTGTPIFYIKYSPNYHQNELRKIIEKATAIATKNIPLRPNAVDSLTGKNLGTNEPIFYFEESKGKLEINLMLKGGGSENVSAIYQLPNKELNAKRNLDGVRRCVLDAVFRAQGKGCPPYILGVAAGGNIEQVAHLSKHQLLRKLDDGNAVSELKKFEKNILSEINQLGIGPLGLGGKTTALAVKAIFAPRNPPSFFVGISMGCWCLRRQKLVI